MHDREEESEGLIVHEQKTAQSLQSVALLLKGLYGQMNEEREIITMASGQMAHAVKQFEQHLIKFEAFEKTCRNDLADKVKTELKQSVKAIANTIAHEVTDVAYGPIKHVLNSFAEFIKQHKQQILRQKRSKLLGSMLFLGAALLGGLSGGLIVQRLPLQTSQSMKVQLAAGGILMRSWNQLSKTEQEKIMKLGGKGAK